MQGFDYGNQMTMVNRQHEERLADARREHLVRAARDERAGARFDRKPVPTTGWLQGLTAWLSGLGRTGAAQTG